MSGAGRELTPQEVLADLLGSGDFPAEVIDPEAAAEIILRRLEERWLHDCADHAGGPVMMPRHRRAGRRDGRVNGTSAALRDGVESIWRDCHRRGSVLGAASQGARPDRCAPEQRAPAPTGASLARCRAS